MASCNNLIVRDLARGVRLWGRNNALGLVLAIALVVPIAGCWTDIPYDASNDSEPLAARQGEAERAKPTPPAEDEPRPEPPAPSAVDDFGAEQFGEELAALAPDAPQSSETEPTPEPLEENAPAEQAEPQPQAPVAPTNGATPDEAATPESSEEATGDAFNSEADDAFIESLFGTDPMESDADPGAEPSEQPPTGEPTSAERANTQPPNSEPRLPWEIGDDSLDSGDTQPEGEPAADAPPQDAQPPLTWAAPGDSSDPPAADERLPGEQTGDLQETDEQTTDEQAIDQQPSDEWQPADRSPAAALDTRQLTWQLSSRLSYVLVAPDADVQAATDELVPVAKALDVDLPALEPPATIGRAAQLRQLLAVGRELGQSVASRHGADHAAIVEIAFKSNLLMAVAESRPQLKHSVNGSVAAASVRAGVPEAIWQPWQDRIAETESSAAIADAVVELHTQMGNYFLQPAATEFDSTSPVLR